MFTGIGAYPYSLVAYRLSKIDIEGTYNNVISKKGALDSAILNIIHESVQSFASAPLTDNVFRYISISTWLSMFGLLQEAGKVALHDNTVESLQILLRVANVPDITATITDSNQVQSFTEPELKVILVMYAEMVDLLPANLSEPILVIMLRLTTLIANFIHNFDINNKRFPHICNYFLRPALFLWRNSSSSLESWTTFFSLWLKATLFTDIHLKNILSLSIDIGCLNESLSGNKSNKKSRNSKKRKHETAIASTTADNDKDESMSITTISHSNAYCACLFDTLRNFTFSATIADQETESETETEKTTKILRFILATVTSSSTSILQSETTHNSKDETAVTATEQSKRERFEERILAQRFHTFRCLHFTLVLLKTLLFTPISQSSQQKLSLQYAVAKEVLRELTVSLAGRALPNHPSTDRYITAMRELYQHLLVTEMGVEVMEIIAVILTIDHRFLLEQTTITLTQTLLYDPPTTSSNPIVTLLQAKQGLFVTILHIFRDLRLIEQLFRSFFTIFATNSHVTPHPNSFYKMLNLPKVRHEVLLALQSQLDGNILNCWKCLGTFLSTTVSSSSSGNGMLLYVAMMLFKCCSGRSAVLGSNVNICCQWMKLTILTIQTTLVTATQAADRVEKVFALQTISAMCQFMVVEFVSTMDQLTVPTLPQQQEGEGDSRSVLQCVDEILLPTLTSFIAYACHSSQGDKEADGEEVLLAAAHTLYALQVLTLNRHAKLTTSSSHASSPHHIDAELFLHCLAGLRSEVGGGGGRGSSSGAAVLLLWQAMLVWPCFNDDNKLIESKIQSILLPLSQSLLLLNEEDESEEGDVVIDMISSSFYLDHVHIATHLATSLISLPINNNNCDSMNLKMFAALAIVCFQHPGLDPELVLSHAVNLLGCALSDRHKHHSKELFAMLNQALTVLVQATSIDKKKMKKSILQTLNNDLSRFIYASFQLYSHANMHTCHLVALALAKLLVVCSANLCDVTFMLTKVKFLLDCKTANNDKNCLIMMLIRAVYDYYAQSDGNAASGDQEVTTKQKTQMMTSFHTLLEALQTDHENSDFIMLMLAEHLRGLSLCQVHNFDKDDDSLEELQQLLQDLFSHILLASTHNRSSSKRNQGWIYLFAFLAKYIPTLLQLTFEEDENNSDLKKLSLVLKAVLALASSTTVLSEECASVLAAGIVDFFVSSANTLQEVDTDTDTADARLTSILHTLSTQLLQRLPRMSSLTCALTVRIQGHFLRQTLLLTPSKHMFYTLNVFATLERMLQEYIQELEQCVMMIQDCEREVLQVCVDEVWAMQQAILTTLHTVTEDVDEMQVDGEDQDEEVLEVDAVVVKRIVRIWSMKVPSLLTSLLSSCSSNSASNPVEVLQVTRTVILLQHDFFGFIKASCAGHVPSQLSTMTHAVCYTLRLLQQLAMQSQSSDYAAIGAMIKENLQLLSRLIAAWQSMKAAEKHVLLFFSSLIDTLAHGHHGAGSSKKQQAQQQAQQQEGLSKHQQDILHPGLFAVFEKLTTKDRQFIFKRLDNSAREVMTVLNDEYNRNYRFQGN